MPDSRMKDPQLPDAVLPDPAKTDAECTPDETFVRRAVDQADLNALRLALYQVTRDPDLAAMRVTRTALRGGAYFYHSLADEDHQVVKDKAVAYLMSEVLGNSSPSPANGAQPYEAQPYEAQPNDDELQHLLELLTGEPLKPQEFRFAVEELALAEFPREARWEHAPEPDQLEQFHVLVIGAGASGLAVGVKLGRLGIPYTIIERQDDLTGTWNINTYPDVRVDTSSYLYQFKFEKKYPWSEFFPSQQEVKRYLTHVATKHDVLRHIMFGAEVESAAWDKDTQKWQVEVRDREGEVQRWTPNVVVSASGLFNKPKWPDIPGMDKFEGTILHTARWDNDYRWEGKRIGLLGNGSSGTQVMPILAQSAAKLTVFQRTPSWIIQVRGHKDKTTPEVHWLMEHMPHYWNWFGYVQFIGTFSVQEAQSYDPQWQAAGGAVSERNDGLRRNLTDYIRGKVGHDEHLFKNSVPDYAPLARRIVIDNGWYDALNRPNVDLVVDGIQEFTATGVLTRSGAEIPLDLMVLGAGFEVSRYFWPVAYTGVDGVTLEEQWAKDGARAYLGMTMPNFPNFFCLYGPNAQPRAGGFLSWVDVWSRYITSAIAALVESGSSSMECRDDVFQDYNRRMDEATVPLIWEVDGAGSYFVNEFGRSGVQMPWRAEDYHDWVRSVELADYIVK